MFINCIINWRVARLSAMPCTCAYSDKFSPTRSVIDRVLRPSSGSTYFSLLSLLLINWKRKLKLCGEEQNWKQSAIFILRNLETKRSNLILKFIFLIWTAILIFWYHLFFCNSCEYANFSAANLNYWSKLLVVLPPCSSQTKTAKETKKSADWGGEYTATRWAGRRTRELGDKQ